MKAHILKANIKTSGFSLAKGKELTGDDFYDIKTIGDLSIAVVCDGMGSAIEGAEASKRVVAHLINNFKIRPKSWSIEKSLLNFTSSINSILYKESMLNYERPEIVTTLCVVVIQGNRLYGANVGDSRVYMQRNNILSQLSHDHSMDEEGYENVLTKAIGIEENIEPFYFENIVQKDDKLLLCSDGLYTLLDDEVLGDNLILGSHGLVKKASKKMDDDLPDDTTAVVIEILQADEVDMLKRQKLIIPESLKVRQIIDGYELKKPLIENERTWLCHKKTKDYIIKFALFEAKDDELILDIFVKEAWNAKRLKADFFPKAVIPKNRTHRYYVMQKFDGEDLDKFLTHKSITIDDSVELTHTLLKMGQYLINYDLVHGDIKPNNIMIAKDDDENIEFKIIDFGSITEVFSNDTRDGTPSFLSPQRFQNEAISESSEIFAIGVTLYLALTGKYPYGEVEPFSSPSFKQAKRPSDYNLNIPHWLDSIILRAIAIDIEQRYDNYSEMEYELTHPKKVKPYFSKNASIIERSPLLFYKTAFIVMCIVNAGLLVYLNS